MARVTWSPTARVEYEHVLSWIANKASVETALRFAAKIRASLQALEAFPEIGAPVEDIPVTGYRERLVGRYRIIYRYDGEECRIHHVVAAERDLGRIISPEDLV